MRYDIENSQTSKSSKHIFSSIHRKFTEIDTAWAIIHTLTNFLNLKLDIVESKKNQMHTEQHIYKDKVS